MVAEGAQIGRTGTSRTGSFRRSFLVSYAARIGERLEDAAARAVDPQADDRLLPVLADRSRVVAGTFKEMYSPTVRKSVSVTNGAGWHAGQYRLSIVVRTTMDNRHRRSWVGTVLPLCSVEGRAV